jgi:hypothetical protein
VTSGALRRPALLAAFVLMVIAALVRWPVELTRALGGAGGWQQEFLQGYRELHGRLPGMPSAPDAPGAGHAVRVVGSHDFQLRYAEVRAWFAGTPFEIEGSGTYPPASYPLLWLGFGWLPLVPAIVAWAALNVLLLAWLARIAIRESRCPEPLERACVAAFLFASSAPLVTIGNGQLTIVVVAGVLASALASRAPDGRGAVATLGMLVALVKPNLSAPFFWMLVFGATSLAPAFLVAGGYVALTLFAAAFQRDGVGALFARWIATDAWQAGRFTYFDLPEVLRELGAWRWALPVSLALLAAAGAWTWRHRRVDVWLQLGVLAVVARIWATHRAYDDLLVTIAMIALVRALRDEQLAVSGRRVGALLLLANVLAQLAPVTLALVPGAGAVVFRAALAVVWIGTGALLGALAARSARALRSAPA